MMSYFLILLLCYLIGSIPFGYLIVKFFKGVDIRNVGSGNIGATNVGRLLGKKGFILVFLLDFLKGFLPIYLLSHYYPESYLLLISAMLVIFGHMFSLFLKFKGGKGVATSLGVFLALAPVGIILAVFVFLLVILLSKMVSLSSILSAFSAALFLWLTNPWFELNITVSIIVLFIIIRHKDNIKRIVKGEEHKIGVRIDNPS
ncbi:MAG: glycerol-3-phosphate 1-O-acyltransferase PlsY [Deferribacterota bacterium]|nr:glycerol-3-phosphate 1-O-acyltransferase PlsY [Deferribacterota bacterium]